MKPSIKDLEFCKFHVSGVAAAAIDKMIADRSAPSTWQISDIPKVAWRAAALLPIIIFVVVIATTRVVGGVSWWVPLSFATSASIICEMVLFSKAILVAEGEARWRARSRATETN